MISPDRFHRVDAIFDAALKLPPHERDGYVLLACAGDAELGEEVGALLRSAATAESALGENVAEFAALLIENIASESGADQSLDPDARLGAWRVVREIGRGGMGAVYLAERADGAFALTVAIKVVKRGLDTADVLRRFHAERRILASLDSTNVARLLDGGETPDGRPYLVMEYVDGQPIVEWCGSRQLDVRQRVALFRDVCGAVHEAHRRLVVHRDVKPSNVLVTNDGIPKLLDFGIAKLLDDDDATATRTGVRLLTPEYAAPEQLRGDPVTTATDVFALGRLLLEILGKSNPPRNGQSSDLDTIVRRAMAPEPERRYGSALQLGEDLERWMRGLPVLARPDSVSYRARKFVRRNRGAVTAASISLLLLVAFTMFLADARRRTAAALIQAEQERDTAEEVAAVLEGIFDAGDPTTDRRERLDTFRVATLLDRSAVRVREELAGRPVVQARLLRSLGNTYRGLGLYDQAGPLLHDAVAAQRALPDSLALAEALSSLALLELQRGKASEAEPRLRESIALRRASAEADQANLTRVIANLAGARQDQGDFEEAAQLYSEAQLRADTAAEPDTSLIALILNGRGMLAHRTGDIESGVSIGDRLLAIDRARLGNEHPRVAIGLANVAFMRERLGKLGAADSLYSEAVTMLRATVGEEHPLHYGALVSLANVRTKLGRRGEARPMFERALSGTRRMQGESPDLAMALSKYADMLEADGEMDDAEAAVAEAIAIERSINGPAHPNVGITTAQLARLRCARGAYDDASAMYQDALDVFARALPPAHPRVLTVRGGLARCLTRASRFDEAEALLTASLETAGGSPAATTLPAPARPVAADLADLYEAWGRSADAARYRALADSTSVR